MKIGRKSERYMKIEAGRGGKRKIDRVIDRKSEKEKGKESKKITFFQY